MFLRVLYLKIFKVKLDNIFNKVCPDIILANNRTAKLKAFATYDIISITNNNGVKTIGQPPGIKWIKNEKKPIWPIDNKVKPISNELDNKKVWIIKAVTVKLYGINPIKLLNK